MSLLYPITVADREKLEDCSKEKIVYGKVHRT